ncbi:MAG TPA: hypothetical protein VGR77_04105 [Candidatus Dormibacteraeota bacterium]|nr:hypothetical protein [Candidatus Dormibacteraeota bacterium]
MGTPGQAIRRPLFANAGDNQRLVWALWIIVTVIGAVVGTLVAWQVRVFVAGDPAFSGQPARYAATVLQAIIASGAQWLLLRRLGLDLDRWVPASVIGNLLAAIVVIPSVLRIADSAAGAAVISPGTAVFAGAAALAAAGLIVGLAQALVLRESAGNVAWAWIPATVVGGALAGALTTALSAQLFGFPYFVTLSLVAATGGLLAAASQAPVFLRVIR